MQPLFWTEDFQKISERKYQIETIPIPIHLGLESVFGLLTYRIEKTTMFSPGSATFGGIFVPPEISLDVQSIKTILSDLCNKLGVENCTWVFPPEFLISQNFVNQISAIKSFSNYGESIETNQHVLVSEWDKSKLSHGNRKKLNQFKSKKGEVLLNDFFYLKQSVQLLQYSRLRKGVNLSMSFEQIESCFKELGKFYSLFTAILDNEVVGAAITVDFGFSTRYVLYWGDSDHGRKYSVTVALFEAILQSAKNDTLKYLDLGVSSVLGKLDNGLYKFKSNLGATTSFRTTINFRLLQ